MPLDLFSSLSVCKKNQIHDTTLYPDILKTQILGLVCTFWLLLLMLTFRISPHWPWNYVSKLSLPTFCKFQFICKMFVESSSFDLSLYAVSHRFLEFQDFRTEGKHFNHLAQQLFFTEEISSKWGYVSYPSQSTGLTDCPVGMAVSTHTPTTVVCAVHHMTS